MSANKHHSLSHCPTVRATNYFARMVILDPSPPAFKQCRGSYFYYNRAVIGLASAQATSMRIDIDPHKRPRRKPPHRYFSVMTILFSVLDRSRHRRESWKLTLPSRIIQAHIHAPSTTMTFGS